MHIFFEPNVAKNTVLSEKESNHAARVLRLSTSDEVIVLNGSGTEFHCAIDEINRKVCELRILSKKIYKPTKHTIHIAISPTKNIDRIEWFVEKCVELGIDEISFIISKNSERKILKIDRLERIAVAAMKQAKQVYLPKIHTISSYTEFLQQCKNSNKYIAHLVNDNRNSLKSIPKESDYCVLIGPEGDFTPFEVEQALETDFLPVHLGTSRLRTETAGIAACHILNLMNE